MVEAASIPEAFASLRFGAERALVPAGDINAETVTMSSSV
jgi:hypothetical protein